MGIDARAGTDAHLVDPRQLLLSDRRDARTPRDRGFRLALPHLATPCDGLASAESTRDGGGVLVFRSGCLAGDLLAALPINRAGGRPASWVSDSSSRGKD